MKRTTPDFERIGNLERLSRCLMDRRERSTVFVLLCRGVVANGMIITFLPSCCSFGYEKVSAQALNQYRLNSLQPILYHIIPFGDSVHGELYVGGSPIKVCASVEECDKADRILSEEERKRLWIIDTAYRAGWDVGRSGEDITLSEIKIPDETVAEHRDLWRACWQHGASAGLKVAAKGTESGSNVKA